MASQIQPVDAPPHAGNVPTDNLFTYTFHNRDVWRRFNPSDDKVIFHEPITSRDLTRAQLRDDSLRFAKSIHKLLSRVSPKDDFGIPGALVGPVIMVHLPNCCAFPVIFFGGLAAKCTMNLVSPALGPQELVHALELVEPDVILTQPSELGEDFIKKALQLLSKRMTEPKIFSVNVVRYPIVGRERTLATNDWLELLNTDASFNVEPMTAHEQAHRAGCILWSSGTTGKSKGVMHSHLGLVASSVLFQKWARYNQPNDVWIGLPPFYHIMGLENIMMLAPLYGTKIVLMRKFDLEAYLRLIVHYRVTYLNLAPPLALALAKTPLLDEPWCDVSSVRDAGCGAAPLGADIIREFYKRTGIPILMGYGLSEAGGFTYWPNQSWKGMAHNLD